MKNKQNIIFIIVIIFITIIALGFSQVSAQTSLPLTVAPARQQLTLDPGQSTAVNVRFYNLSESPVSGFIKVADFIVDNPQGEPRIVEDVSQVSPRFSAQSWFSLPFDRVTIASNDKVSFQAKINIPIDAHPGGRYVAIYFEPTNSLAKSTSTEKGAGVSVGSRLASLIYLKINGETSEKALVSRFFAPSFFEYGPIKIETQILNRGDYHIRPKGTITLTNAFGALVNQSNLKEENIFPDVVRNYENNLGKKWMMGKYKLSLIASYGEKGQVLERFIYVWVFPWRVALALILAVLILIYIINNLFKGIASKETELEKELNKEKVEIEKLKTQLRKKG